MVLEKTLESPLDCKEIQPVHPKRNQSCMFFRRTDVEAETPIHWPPDVKSWLIWKDPDAGKDWGQEEEGMTEDEMVGWHHWLDERKFGWTLGVGDGWWGLACCGSQGHESDKTEGQNWTELYYLRLSHFSSVAQSCPTLCDPIDCSSPAAIVFCKYSLKVWKFMVHILDV